MDPLVTGALISAGSNLLGGLFGNSKDSKIAAQNIALQKQFAKQGIQWKAADAEKAGISKLYALGANTISYQPQQLGSNPLGDGLAAAGQDIGRAVAAGGSQATKVGATQQQMAQIQLEGLRLDNEIKRTEIASKLQTLNQPGTPPGANDAGVVAHIPGQGDSTIKYEKTISPSSSNMEHRSFGVSPEVDMYKTSQGWAPMPPQAVGEALESIPLANWQYYMRNHLAPAFSTARQTVPFKAPEGKHWKFNPIMGEYTLHDDYRVSGRVYNRGGYRDY